MKIGHLVQNLLWRGGAQINGLIHAGTWYSQACRSFENKNTRTEISS